MSEVWIASHILLWFAVVTQGLIIVALMRQVGSLLLRVGSVEPFESGSAIRTGALAPWSPSEDPTNGRRLGLLAFLSTTCSACDTLVPALNSVRASYADELSSWIIGRESSIELSRWAQTKRLRGPLLSAPEAFEAYGITLTPYVVVLSDDGRIAAQGGVNHIEHLESLIRACSADEEETSLFATSTGDGLLEGDGHGH